MWNYLLILIYITFSNCENHITSMPTTLTHETIPAITTKQFQLQLVNEVNKMIDATTHNALNQFLEQMQQNTKYTQEYANEFEIMTQPNTKVSKKIVFIKQLLDLKNDHRTNIDEHHFNTLRNINFLKKIRQRMDELYEEAANDLRYLRMYALCKQFHKNKQTLRNAEEHTPYSRNTKLMPLMEEETREKNLAKLNAQNHNISISITVFGKNLYNNVKNMGAEIINEFMYSIRKLLHEVIEDKPDDGPQITKLHKFIIEIDNILEIEDFFQKRQRLYTYLQSNLAIDYEQLQQEQEDLADIFSKLKEKGLNVFVAFLFSNFEFLEHLHAEWHKLLPKTLRKEHLQYYDESTQLLANISLLYDEFKKDNENDAKYEAYMQSVRQLQEKNSASSEYMPIYELLHNASLNVGSVTMNIIRAKCEEV